LNQGIFFRRKYIEFLKTPNIVNSTNTSQTWGEKVLSREGNSPDRQLRFLKITKWWMLFGILYCMAGRLRSSHPI